MNNAALKMYVFYCSSRLEAGRFTELSSGHDGDAIKTISLPCSGKVDIPYLIKAFETGADGVAIVTCNKDECSNFEGNLRAHKRAEAVEALLEEIGVSPGRMAVFECAKDDPGSIIGEIRKFLENLRGLPRTYAQSGAAIEQESTGA